MSESDPLGLVGLTIDELRFDECVDTEGEGLVYRGKLAGRESPVAIKCLSLSRLGGTDGQMRAKIAARFSEETKILRRLADGTHDIVQCIADGRLAAPTNGETVQYQVLEWLDGRSLRVDFNEREERKMPGRSLRETMDLMESAAMAMAHAHTQGIVHRDLQPTKMMLVRVRGGMHLKILDFGLAKTLGRDSPIGADLATFSSRYCAPEQIAKNQGDIGPWSDVWALALIMLEMLSGKEVPDPQAGSIRASAIGVQVPASIEDVLARATSLDPHARPLDAGVFWREMREAYSHMGNKPVTPFAADALAATALDADAAAAIARIRAMTAGGPPQSDKGTMLMAASPPHPMASIPIQEGPLAGTKPIAIPSPLASSIGGNMATPVGPAPRKGTAAMPATPAIKPITPMPGPVPQQQQQQQQQQPLGPALVPTPKSHALVIGGLVALILAIVIVAILLFVIR